MPNVLSVHPSLPARSVHEFIRLYLTRYDRMGSPKFLAGESYGTTRAAGLSGTLADAGIVLNGVTLPKLVKDIKPKYTSEAMRAKVQGTVLLECVVRPDGSVGDVVVKRSLDPTFGLDQEAIKAAQKWEFVPGTRMGEPVPVLVTIELTFTLR